MAIPTEQNHIKYTKNKVEVKENLYEQKGRPKPGNGIAIFQFLPFTGSLQALRSQPQEEPLKATCKTSMFSGVYWADGPAPMGDSNEPSACLSCGTTLPRAHETCPKCSWTYKA